MAQSAETRSEATVGNQQSRTGLHSGNDRPSGVRGPRPWLPTEVLPGAHCGRQRRAALLTNGRRPGKRPSQRRSSAPEAVWRTTSAIRKRRADHRALRLSEEEVSFGSPPGNRRNLISRLGPPAYVKWRSRRYAASSRTPWLYFLETEAKSALGTEMDDAAIRGSG